jgi:hypothetical protein
MKKFFLLFLVLNSFTISYAQYIIPKDLLTDAEKEVTEQTKDDAYVAPSSKLIGKKWYALDPDLEAYYILNQNGTGSLVMQQVYPKNRFGPHPIKITSTIPIQWKRRGLDLTISNLYGSTTVRVLQSSLAQYSLRVQDEIKTAFVEAEKKMRQNGTKTYTNKILKFTNDILITDGAWYVTQSKAEELLKRKADANR